MLNLTAQWYGGYNSHRVVSAVKQFIWTVEFWILFVINASYITTGVYQVVFGKHHIDWQWPFVLKPNVSYPVIHCRLPNAVRRSKQKYHYLSLCWSSQIAIPLTIKSRRCSLSSMTVMALRLCCLPLLAAKVVLLIYRLFRYQAAGRVWKLSSHF